MSAFQSMSFAVAVVSAMCASCLGLSSILQPILPHWPSHSNLGELSKVVDLVEGAGRRRRKICMGMVTEISWGKASILVSGLTIISNWLPYTWTSSVHTPPMLWAVSLRIWMQVDPVSGSQSRQLTLT